MNPCKKVGIDVTWRCNASCVHCYYLRNSNLHQPIDVPLPEITQKIDHAKAGGLDHVYLVGFGEPTLAPHLTEILDYARNQGMPTSIITDGTTSLTRLQECFIEHGLDHLHISAHGVGGTLDTITRTPGAFRRQTDLKTWLTDHEYPYRTNTTLQQLNYRELPEIAEYEINHKVLHFVFLGFNVHYEWTKAEHLQLVAVPPVVLRPYIEEAARRLLDARTYFTIRYHPFCHLNPDLWKYVVNARYVFFDPWEWNYTLQVHDREALWKAAVQCGESVAIQGAPCDQCLARRHCGGWNRHYAAAFDGAGLQPIREVPDQYRDMWEQDGGLHDLNRVNALSGTIRVPDPNLAPRGPS